MEKEKEKFFKIQDWEKEYLDDYLSAKDTISYFDEIDKDYCKKEFYKHTRFIKMKFQRIVNTRKVGHG